MSLSRYPQITEELLSAYLDDLVSEEERQMVEQAAADDPQIAWQLASLQQTVALLQNLSTLALPRSFAINAAMLDAHDNRQPAVAVAPQERTTARESWWQKLVAALQGGNAPLRNAATAAAILLVILVAGSWLLSPEHTQQVAMNMTSVDATVDTPVDTTAPSTQSENSATQEVATAETVTALAAVAPQANSAMKQPAAEAIQAEARRAEADESPTAVAPAAEPIAMARVTTPNAEGTTTVEPTATMAQVIAAAVPEEPQITTETETEAEADSQRAATTASTIQSAPLATASRPSGDDTQPLEGADAAPMAFQAPTDNLMTDNGADSPTGTMQPPTTVAETPENNSAIASAPAAIDETAHGISAAAAATMEENTTTDGQPTAVADSAATKSAQENQPVATPTAIEIDDTSTISLTAAADLTVTLATTGTELTATVPLSEQLTITMSNSITDTDTVINTVINTGTIAITNTVMVTDTPMLSPTVTVTPGITVSPTMTLTERSLITSTISVPLLSESHSVTATRSAESTPLAPVESIATTATSVKPEPTVTKTVTRRATAATVTPLHTPIAPPEVTTTATMTVTLTATLTATSTPTMTTTPTATGTITATPLITGTLTPAAISLGQQPIIMVMNATGAVEQSGQSMFHWMIQLLLSLLVMTWITLWWRRETTISRLQHTMQPVTKHKVEQKEEHA